MLEEHGAISNYPSEVLKDGEQVNPTHDSASKASMHRLALNVVLAYKVVDRAGQDASKAEGIVSLDAPAPQITNEILL